MREKRGRRRRIVVRRSARGLGRKLNELTASCDEGSWDLRERSNNSRRMRGLKIREIRTGVDGEGVGVMSSEGLKSCVIPRRDVSVGGVKISVHFILVSPEGGENKNSWTGERCRRIIGGRKRSRRRDGGEDRRRRMIFSRIHILIFFFFGGGVESRR
jgi:hypothetical protein